MSDYDFVSIPDPVADLGNLAEVARALKKSTEIIIQKSADWDKAIASLQTVTGTASTGTGTGTGAVYGTTMNSSTKSAYNFDDPSYDAVFDAAVAKARAYNATVRSEVVTAYAALETALLNFKSGIEDTNSVVDARVSSLSATLDETVAGLSREEVARATSTQALSGTVMRIHASVGANTAAITTEQVTRANADSALASQITTLTSTVGSTSAAIASEATTRASADSALSTRIDTVTAQSNAGTASGYYRLTALSNATDGAAAEFAVEVKASANSAFTSAGMRIQVFSNGTSRIKMMADQFLIQSSSGNYTPFAVVSGQLISNALTSAGNVSGLGALATQNSVSAGNVSGLGSLATQNSVSSGQVSGLGSMALINKISALNIATYMDNAVISNAYIGDAEISTLKVAGNAITTGASIYGSYQMDLTAGNWVSFVSVFTTLTGQQSVNVWCSFGMPAAHVATGGESVDGYYDGYPYHINSLTSDVLFKIVLTSVSGGSYGTVIDSGVIMRCNTGIGVTYVVALGYTFPSWQYSISPGLWKVEVRGYTNPGYETCGARTISLSVLETKR
jgi:hypothetical protein